MSWLLQRIRPVAKQLGLNIFLATGSVSVNQAYQEFGVTVFHGNDENLPERHLELAQQEQITHIINVDGDDICISPDAIRNCAYALEKGSDWVRTKGLPIGMNASGYSVQGLYSFREHFQRKSVFDTDWLGFVKDWTTIDRHIPSIPCAHEWKVTLDYPEDLEFFRLLYRTNGNSLIGDDLQILSGIQAIQQQYPDTWDSVQTSKQQYLENLRTANQKTEA